MKKALAILMTLALILSAVALPALAEDVGEAPDTVSSATQTQPHGGKTGNPGRNNQNDPQPGGSSQQAPSQPEGQDSQQVSDQADSALNPQHLHGGRPGRNGNQFGKNSMQMMHINLDQLLAAGVITQEVYDAIVAYLQQNTPQAQSGNGAPAGNAAPEAGSEPPALPGNAPDGQTSQESPEAKLLNLMLEAGIITQEQYDQVITMLSATEAAPAL